jgi:hypothetical protein
MERGELWAVLRVEKSRFWNSRIVDQIPAGIVAFCSAKVAIRHAFESTNGLLSTKGREQPRLRLRSNRRLSFLHSLSAKVADARVPRSLDLNPGGVSYVGATFAGAKGDNLYSLQVQR